MLGRKLLARSTALTYFCTAQTSLFQQKYDQLLLLSQQWLKQHLKIQKNLPCVQLILMKTYRTFTSDKMFSKNVKQYGDLQNMFQHFAKIPWNFRMRIHYNNYLAALVFSEFIFNRVKKNIHHHLLHFSMPLLRPCSTAAPTWTAPPATSGRRSTPPRPSGPSTPSGCSSGTTPTSARVYVYSDSKLERIFSNF